MTQQPKVKPSRKHSRKRPRTPISRQGLAAGAAWCVPAVTLVGAGEPSGRPQAPRITLAAPAPH